MSPTLFQVCFENKECLTLYTDAYDLSEEIEKKIMDVIVHASLCMLFQQMAVNRQIHTSVSGLGRICRAKTIRSRS